MIELETPTAKVDFEKFRLRTFMKTLAAANELEEHRESVSLGALSSLVDASLKATHFTNVGTEGYEMIGAVAGSRKRIALALGVDPREIAHEYMRRAGKLQPVVEVASADAPVHEIVRIGDDVDLTTLPFHPQHQCDGGTYISAGMDFTVDPITGRTNVGCRRLMLRGKREMRSNLTAYSDLKRMYLAAVERGERLPVSFVVGAHPLDFLAASNAVPVEEFGFIGTLRGEPVPMVRSVTNNIPVPADAEMVIEGYFDELGYREWEGPYGEFFGFYGPVHIDPVFHVTAITTRKDVLHQTVLHGGRFIGRADSASFASLHTEVAVWRALRAARIEPAAVFAMPSTNGRPGVRVALKNPTAGEARRVCHALFTLPPVKAVYVVDDDIDVFSDDEVQWAMTCRFRADQDVVLAPGMPPFYADMALSDDGTLAKIGFDLTRPASHIGDPLEMRRAYALQLGSTGAKRAGSVREALGGGPLYFAQIMDALGSEDGREIALELDRLREEDAIDRTMSGEWILKGVEPGS